MTTTLGGVTLADPIYPTPKRFAFVGVQENSHNGTLLTDWTARKWRWTLEWKLLTQAQYDVILARALVTDGQSFSPPEITTTYTVVVIQESVEVSSYLNGNATNYDLKFEVEVAS